MDYMLFHRLVDLHVVDELGGGAVLGYWSRVQAWSEERRKRTSQPEFLEWSEWLATAVARCRAKQSYVPAYAR